MRFEFCTSFDDRFKEVDRIAKEFFQIENDPSQIDADEKTFLRSLEIGGKTLCAYENEKMIGWSFAFPTSRFFMNLFLSNRITERELFWTTKKDPNYDAIYFCAMYVYPEYRSLSLALKLVHKCMEPLWREGTVTFYDPYSYEGKILGEFIRNRNKSKINSKKFVEK